MSLPPDVIVVERDSRPPNFLDESELDALGRLTRLVARLFHVPVAYAALLGSDLKVTLRVGVGTEYAAILQTYPLAAALSKPQLWPDPSGVPVDGFVCGDLKFAALAPLRSSDGLELGVLAIADLEARPAFSRIDLDSLAELAAVLTRKLELRAIAGQAREAELSLNETEDRFRNIADCAPVMILCIGLDGGGSFVNRAWIEFTGRSIEDELGDGFQEAFHRDYRMSVMEAYWKAFQRRKPFVAEFPMRRHDGEYRWMQARGMPQIRDNGRFVGYVGVFVDLTEQCSVPPLPIRKHLESFDVAIWL